MSNPKKAIVVFSGFNQRAVIAFLRTLEHLQVQYAIIASSKDDLIFLTSYKSKVATVRENFQLDLDDLLNCIDITKRGMKADKYVIAPSTEALNRFLLENRNTFENVDCEIPLVEKGLYEEISDKESFEQMCKLHALSVPEKYDNIETIKLPCVAKPRTYFSPDGHTYSPALLFTRNDLDDFLNKYNSSDFYFQEFIEGDSYYLLYYFYRDGRCVKISQRNLLQQPSGKSIIAAQIATIHNDIEFNMYEKMFKKINYFGLVMLEVRGTNNKYYMIEANPRFWGPSQLFVDANQNLFEDFLVDNNIIPKKNDELPRYNTKYFWYGGYIDSHDDISYHGVDYDDFEKDISSWLSADIYNRKDTHDLYERENLKAYELPQSTN